ncbi:glycosyltransferase family 2 protein [Pelodictyon luteolum]|uniref:Glycosyl transferase n=1 Tax=Chlorobium luteolum (strain DSM 273 / BCRC 81028 / 2530) TaxID=319225 RepID=Q3B6H2_CHLL3|nr:glycosyltransferase family 2 protein [Pelodictyon luteolum]ABB23059.1 glycosyl transferase [Pelodictyon luteolum DSM 273]
MNSPACIVVVNWNGADDTIRCLRSLEPVRSSACMVLVVDNGSDDGSAARIRSACPGTEVLELPLNIGYGAGCNAGFRRAEELGARTMIFLNNDTLVDPSFAMALLLVLSEDPTAGMAVPKILYADRPGTIWYAGGEVNLGCGLVQHTGIRRNDGPGYSRPGHTGYATGCCFAMRTRDFRAVGGFDEGFGMYAEDVDLSLRVRQLGLSIEYEPSSVVLHRVSASYRGRPLRKLWLRSKGILRLLRKHGSWMGMLMFLLLEPFRLVRGAASMAALSVTEVLHSTRCREEGGAV